MIRALEEWRHYVQGSPHTTVVFSDHKNLTYFREARKLNRRQARWSLYLSEFDVKLEHMSGMKMIQSDTLSRRPDYILDKDEDNENVIMLPSEMFVNLIDMELQEKISSCDNLDKDAMEALTTLLGQESNLLKNELEDWSIERTNGKNMLFYKGKNYIPKDLDLRRYIVKQHHDAETAGHPGELETYNTVRQHYWWPGMRTFVNNYVKGCGICQQFKIDRSPSKPVLMPTEGGRKPPDRSPIVQWT